MRACEGFCCSDHETVNSEIWEEEEQHSGTKVCRADFNIFRVVWKSHMGSGPGEKTSPGQLLNFQRSPPLSSGMVQHDMLSSNKGSKRPTWMARELLTKLGYKQEMYGSRDSWIQRNTENCTIIQGWDEESQSPPGVELRWCCGLRPAGNYAQTATSFPPTPISEKGIKRQRLWVETTIYWKNGKEIRKTNSNSNNANNNNV